MFLTREQQTHCIEILHSRRHKGLRHRSGCDHTRHGVPVADGLSHGDDVWHKVFSLKLEGPEVRSDAAKAHLNLIGNKNASRFADVPVEGRYVRIQSQTQEDSGDGP